MEKEIDCLTDCFADCCIKGNILELTPEEAGFLEQAGTKVRELLPPNLKSGQLFIRTIGSIRIEDYLPKGVGEYLLMSNCGNLDGQLCGVHNNGQQPQVCKRVKSGSRDCRKIRGD